MPDIHAGERIDVKNLDVALDSDIFFRKMIRTVAGTLEDRVGMDEASGFIAVLGQELGRRIELAYEKSLNRRHFEKETVADILVDLKRRIGGEFSIESVNSNRMVLTNKRCPFGEEVLQRPSLCMMTSNVFGYIVSNSNGYAAIKLPETISQGHGRCRVVIELKMSDEFTESEEYREYFSQS
ncbi:methanogen output domain 1-containing protein [Planctobacterium marinum]|uniref:Metanogen output domain-containing protein n=1 Tax=Planctobacterium marinum TaxID=1631968 RepID=A0AA48KT22_9ALTE|nr:hypothetical protein MACH26_04610 [Planctobacterium marinum]